MADLRDMSNDRLLNAFENAAYRDQSVTALRDELLRRLSAEPERSDGRITEADFQAAMRDPVVVRMLEHYKAEVQQAVSDGRIQAKSARERVIAAGVHGCLRAKDCARPSGHEGECRGTIVEQSGEQRETRIQAQLSGQEYGQPHWIEVQEAQRSVGRVEAGSEQVKQGMWHSAVAHRCAECQDSENGAVTRDGGKIKP